MQDRATTGDRVTEVCCAEIDISIDDAEGRVVVINIKTDIGSVQIIGECSVFDRRLQVDGVHIQGLRPGALGRKKLNQIAQKIMEVADVDIIEINGGTRTTGANQGRPPKRIVARRRPCP